MPQEGVVALTPQESFNVNPPSRQVPLTDTNIHSLRKLIFQLGTKPGQFALGDATGLLLLLVAPATTTTALALGLIKFFTVILDTEILSRRTEPIVFGGDLFFGEGRVGNLLGELYAGTHAGHHAAIDIERFQGQLLERSLLAILRVDLGGETGHTDHFFWRTDNDTLADRAGTSGTSRSVDVRVCCARCMVVDNTVDTLNV